jgi:FAD-dependent fumarate reductase
MPPPSDAAANPSIIIVGGGLAGLAAALEAADTATAALGGGGGDGEGGRPPLSILLLDSQPRLGGNSAKASSGISAVRGGGGGGGDGVAAFEADLLASSVSTVSFQDGAPAAAAPSPRRAAALHALAASSPSALAWLEATSGVDLTSRPPARLGGHGAARTYGPPGGAPVGQAVMGGLGRAVAAGGGHHSAATIHVRTGARAVGLVLAGGAGGGEGEAAVVVVGQGVGGAAPLPRPPPPAGGRVTGVVVEEGGGPDGGGAPCRATTIHAPAVILTTGGFAASPALLAAHAPATAGLPTTNGPWAAGDGVRLGVAAGGATADMGLVQVHPTAFWPPTPPPTTAATTTAATSPTPPPAVAAAAASSAFLAPERLRGVGGILLNAAGRRFANELARRDALAAAVRGQPGGAAWLILSRAAADAYGDGAIAFYEGKGLMSKVVGVDALAALMGAPVDAVAASLAAHDAAAAAADGSAPDPVGRPAHAAGPFGATTPATVFHAGRVCPAVHYTMGGLAIDGDGRVLLREEGGDGGGGGGGPHTVPGLFAAGEVTGGVHGANRLGGCSLLECVVMGRAAGRAAAEWVMKNGG